MCYQRELCRSWKILRNGAMSVPKFTLQRPTFARQHIIYNMEASNPSVACLCGHLLAGVLRRTLVSFVQLGNVELGSLEELDLADEHVLEGIDAL